MVSGKMHLFCNNQATQAFQYLGATSSSMRTLLELAIASKRSAMMRIGENSAVLQPSNISFLIQYLGGYAQLDEVVVGVGKNLEEVGSDGEHSTFFATNQYKLF